VVNAFREWEGSFEAWKAQLLALSDRFLDDEITFLEFDAALDSLIFDSIVDYKASSDQNQDWFNDVLNQAIWTDSSGLYDGHCGYMMVFEFKDWLIRHRSAYPERVRGQHT
jgi:hypothetical protein